MAKNMKSVNSKILKFFLLGCANAAILTAMSGEAMGDIGINDILRRTPEYQALTLAEKLNTLTTLQNSNEYDAATGSERRVFNKEIGEVRIQKAAADKRTPVLDAAAKRRALHIPGAVVGAAVAAPAPAPAFETGRVEKQLVVEDKLQVMNILAKSTNANAVAAKNILEEAIHTNNIENLATPLEKLKYVITSGVTGNNKLKVVTDYANAPLTKNEIEHTIFGTNITDAGIRNKDIEIKYHSVGSSALLQNIRAVDDDAIKNKLLQQFKKYVNENLIETESRKSTPAARQTIMRLADPAKVVTYLETMAKLKEAYIDNGETINLTDYNKALKDAGLIASDLNSDKMKVLIENFDAKAMNELAVTVKSTAAELEEDNKKLVGLVAVAPIAPALVVAPGVGVPPPPPPPRPHQEELEL